MIEKLKPRDENDIFVYTYNEGVAAFNCEDYQIALMKFKEAQKLPNSKLRVLYNIALCYKNLNDFALAIETLNKYIEERPYAYNALEKLFYMYYDLPDYKRAAEIFYRCISIHKDIIIDSYINSFQFNSNSDNVLKFFEAILSVENGKELYIDMLKYLEKERVTFNQTVSMVMIIDLYKQYRDITNEREDTEISISKCYIKMGNLNKAIFHVQKAVVMNPNSYKANEQLAFIYYCNAQYDKAIGYYKKAIELSPTLNYKLYSNLAYSYEKSKKLKEAIKQFEILLDKFKDIPAFYELKFHTEYIKKLASKTNKDY